MALSSLSSLGRPAALHNTPSTHRHHVHHARATCCCPSAWRRCGSSDQPTRPFSTLPKRPVLPSLALRTQHEHEAGAPASCPLQ